MSPTLLRTLMRMQRRGDTEAPPSAYLKIRAFTKPRKEPIVLVEVGTQDNEFAELDTRESEFVELDMRKNDGYTVSLEWNRDTGKTQIVVGDIRTATQLVFPVPVVSAGDAFRHPFRYAP